MKLLTHHVYVKNKMNNNERTFKVFFFKNEGIELDFASGVYDEKRIGQNRYLKTLK